ncbi:MAG: hypothetical protein IJX65_07165 [Alistipes sp.]|nr:hypothetical protein [Alistipes sp.]
MDFTNVKVFAAEESEADFIKAFDGINLLFVSESDKYHFPRLLGRECFVDIEMVMKLNPAGDYSKMKGYSRETKQIDYEALVKGYTLSQSEGTGVIMVAKLIDKPAACATYNLIEFDIATRQILNQREVVGKARGFGLRNYWAYSVYHIIWTTKAPKTAKKR